MKLGVALIVTAFAIGVWTFVTPGYDGRTVLALIALAAGSVRLFVRRERSDA